MESISLKGKYAFYDTENKNLIAVGGGITFGSGGNPTLKLYNTAFWHTIKDRVLARELGVSLDIAKEARSDYACRGAHWHVVKQPEILRDHEDLLKRVDKLLFREQNIIVKVAVDSILIDPTPIK